jgi:hypothetical protein
MMSLHPAGNSSPFPEDILSFPEDNIEAKKDNLEVYKDNLFEGQVDQTIISGWRAERALVERRPRRLQESSLTWQRRSGVE